MEVSAFWAIDPEESCSCATPGNGIHGTSVAGRGGPVILQLKDYYGSQPPECASFLLVLVTTLFKYVLVSSACPCCFNPQPSWWHVGAGDPRIRAYASRSKQQ